MKFSAENPRLRKAANRYSQFMRTILALIFTITTISCYSQDTTKYVLGTNYFMDVGVKTNGRYNGTVSNFRSFVNDSNYKFYSKEYYINGRHVGPDTTFDESGNTWKIYQYTRNGIYFTCFHSNGKVDESGLMRSKEKKFGEWVTFYENGQIESVVYYSNNIENGEALYFYPNGKLKSTGKFSKGYRKGKWLEVDSTGTIISDGIYKPIAVDRSEIDSVNLVPDSLDFPVYMNIIVKWTDFGVKNGIWTTYNNIDKTIFRQEYFNGKLVK